MLAAANFCLNIARTPVEVNVNSAQLVERSKQSRQWRSKTQGDCTDELFAPFAAFYHKRTD